MGVGEWPTTSSGKKVLAVNEKRERICSGILDNLKRTIAEVIKIVIKAILVFRGDARTGIIKNGIRKINPVTNQMGSIKSPNRMLVSKSTHLVITTLPSENLDAAEASSVKQVITTAATSAAPGFKR